METMKPRKTRVQPPYKKMYFEMKAKTEWLEKRCSQLEGQLRIIQSRDVLGPPYDFTCHTKPKDNGSRKEAIVDAFDHLKNTLLETL